MNNLLYSCVSITELQKNTKKVLADINQVKWKIITHYKKPKAIIVSIWEFDKLSWNMQEVRKIDEN